MVKAELVEHNGSPAIRIGQEIFPPMMMTVVTTNKKEQLLDKEKLNFKIFKEKNRM